MKKIFLYLTVIFTASCSNTGHSTKGVELAMKQYDHLIKKMDADSISLLYTPDGDLGNMAHGRDSIRNFLSSFKNVSVVSQSSTTNFLKINGDTAFQKGLYYQTAFIPGKDTIKLKGEYTATWRWMRPGGWHIQRMTTKPLQ